MERTATVQRKVTAEPMRLPAAVDLTRVAAEDAVQALRALMAVVAGTLAQRARVERGEEQEDDPRCPRLREEPAVYAP